MARATKMDKAVIVAHYFISKNKATNKGLSNKKLQKLLYYAQAWSLVLHKKKLFEHKFEAWIHGAALPMIYHKYKEYGFKDITDEYDESEFDALTKKEKQLLDEVWLVYGKHDANYLELLNHNEEPWQNARKGRPFSKPSTAKISEEDMRRYYGDKLQRIKAQRSK